MMGDQAAIEKCGAGDSEAFRHVVEHYQAEAIGHASYTAIDTLSFVPLVVSG
jgi:hypothetical protein